MQKTKFILSIVIFLIAVISTDLKAQHFEFNSGVNLSFYNKGRYQYRDFTTSPAIGYNIGVNFWMYPIKRFPVMLSAHLFQQRGKVTYNYSSLEFKFERTIIFDSRYLVFGFQPYTYKNKNYGFEISMGIEGAIRIHDQSISMSSTIRETSSGRVTSLNRNSGSKSKRLGYSGKICLGYRVDIYDKCEFIPRLIFRLSNLKVRSLVNNETSVGLEFGFRF